MREHGPAGGTGEVVVEHLDDLLGVQLAIAVEVAQQFLLFRVHAHDRLARLQVLLLESGDVLKLSVAIRMSRPHRLDLLRLAFHVPVPLEQLLDHTLPGGRPAFRQPLGNLTPRQVGPLDACPHRVAGGVVPQHVQKVLLQPRADVD